MTCGIFISFNFAMNGMLFNEAENYNHFIKQLKPAKVIVYSYDDSYKDISSHFKFQFEHVDLEKEEASRILDADVMFTWQWHQEFINNRISYKQVYIYKILSLFSNSKNKTEI